MGLTESKKISMTAMMLVATVIKDLKSIQREILYANLFGDMNFLQYMATVDFLKKNGIIREESSVLHWVGNKGN